MTNEIDEKKMTNMNEMTMKKKIKNDEK